MVFYLKLKDQLIRVTGQVMLTYHIQLMRMVKQILAIRLYLPQRYLTKYLLNLRHAMFTPQVLAIMIFLELQHRKQNFSKSQSFCLSYSKNNFKSNSIQYSKGILVSRKFFLQNSKQCFWFYSISFIKNSIIYPLNIKIILKGISYFLL